MWRRPLLPLVALVIAIIVALPMRAQQKPLTQDQVQGMVRDGLGDETGAKALAQRGIDFAPTEEFIQSLKKAGASEAFLAALRAAKHPEPANAKKPINQIQVFALLAGQVPSHRVAMLVQERGIDFEPDDEYLREVRLAGGEDELVSALKSVKVTKPESVDPAFQARQEEIQRHAARGAEYFQQKQYVPAETEYRSAARLDLQNSDFRVALSRALNGQNKTGEATLEAREAIRLNPKNDMAHFSLGAALGRAGDWDGAIMEYREAVRLNPRNDLVHRNLGWALSQKGDSVGALAECHEAVRLNPNNEEAHIFLGGVLTKRGDWDGAVAEYREVLRLNPKNDIAHVLLGVALGPKGDWDGDAAEQREALRLNPNNDSAHYALGVALEQTGNRQEALQEYRAAYELKPHNPDYRKAYEHLLPRPKR